MKRTRVIFFPLTCLLMTACFTNLPMDISRAGGESTLPAGYVVSNVRLDERLLVLEDSLSQMGSTYSVHSGKIFRKVFTGGERAPAVMEWISSRIQQSTADQYIVWQTQQVNYTVTAAFRYKGTSRILSASGIGKTALVTDRAARDAVERAVVDLARQAQFVIREVDAQ